MLQNYMKEACDGIGFTPSPMKEECLINMGEEGIRFKSATKIMKGQAAMDREIIEVRSARFSISKKLK